LHRRLPVYEIDTLLRQLRRDTNGHIDFTIALAWRQRGALLYQVRGQLRVLVRIAQDGQRINVFSGTRFGQVASGSWAELFAADGSILRAGKLTVRLSADQIDVTYQTGKFPERKLTLSKSKPIPFPRLPTHP
jgi:hypothetical protein